jgi:hypothetical protein
MLIKLAAEIRQHGVIGRLQQEFPSFYHCAQ